MALNIACEEHMMHKRIPPSKAHDWWNAECTAAVRALQEDVVADDSENYARDHKRLKKITWVAKRTWADKCMETCTPWEVAKWRHSCKNSIITALKQPDSTLTYNPQEMAATLSRQFTTPDSGIPISSFSDDPPPLPTRPWHPLTGEEIARCLKDTANTSAPGNSGITWWMLKDAWPKVDEHLTWIFNGCLC